MIFKAKTKERDDDSPDHHNTKLHSRLLKHSLKVIENPLENYEIEISGKESKRKEKKERQKRPRNSSSFANRWLPESSPAFVLVSLDFCPLNSLLGPTSLYNMIPYTYTRPMEVLRLV